MTKSSFIITTVVSLMLASCGGNPSVPVKTDAIGTTQGAEAGNNNGNSKPNNGTKPTSCVVYRQFDMPEEVKPKDSLGNKCDCHNNIETGNLFYKLRQRTWSPITKADAAKKCGTKFVDLGKRTPDEPATDVHVQNVKLNNKGDLVVTMNDENQKPFIVELPKNNKDRFNKNYRLSFDPAKDCLNLDSKDQDGKTHRVCMQVAELRKAINTDTDTNTFISDVKLDKETNILSILRSDNQKWDIPLIDKNTTNTALAVNGDDLVLTDSDGNTVSVPVADLNLGGGTTVIEGKPYRLVKEGNDLVLIKGNNVEVSRIPLESIADTTITNASVTHDPATGKLVITDSNGDTVETIIKDRNTTNTALAVNGDDLVLTDSDGNTVSVPVADLNLGGGTTVIEGKPYRLVKEGSDLVLIKGDNVEVSRIPLESIADTTITNASVTHDPATGKLVITDSNGDTVETIIEDRNTTNTALAVNGDDLVLTDSDGNTVSVPVSDLNLGGGTTVIEGKPYRLVKEGNDLVLIKGDNVEVSRIPLAAVAATPVTNTGAHIDPETGELVLTDSNGDTVTTTLPDRNTTNSNFEVRDGQLFLVDSDGNHVAIPLEQINLPSETIEQVEYTMIEKDGVLYLRKGNEDVSIVNLPVIEDKDTVNETLTYDPTTRTITLVDSEGNKVVSNPIPHTTKEKSYGQQSPASLNFPGNEGDLYIMENAEGFACSEWELQNGVWIEETKFKCEDEVIVTPVDPVPVITKISCKLDLVPTKADDKAPAHLEYPYNVGRFDAAASRKVYKTNVWNKYGKVGNKFGAKLQGNRGKPGKYFVKNKQLYFGFKFTSASGAQECKDLKNKLASDEVKIKSATLSVPVEKYQDDNVDITELVAVLNDNHRAYSGNKYGTDLDGGQAYKKALNEKFFGNLSSSNNSTDFWDRLDAGRRSNNKNAKTYVMNNSNFDFASLFGYASTHDVITDIATSHDDTIHMAVADDVRFTAAPELVLTLELNL